MKRQQLSARRWLARGERDDPFANRRSRAEHARKTRDEFCDKGGWMQFPFVFTRMTKTADSALLLGFFYNQNRVHCEQKASSDGWFYCRAGTLAKWLGWNRQKQWREIQKLVALEFIETETRPQPKQASKRYIRLRLSAMRRARQVAIQQSYAEMEILDDE